MKAITIILILCMFVGGASANTISFNAVTNVITVIGFNASHPCTFQDVYNADVAGGWDVIDRYSDYDAMVYMINHTGIMLGNSTHHGYFGDTEKTIIFHGFPAGVNYVFNCAPNKGHIYFGEYDNEVLRTAKNGMNIFVSCESKHTVSNFCKNPVDLYLYGCTINRLLEKGSYWVHIQGTNGRIWHTTFDKGMLQYGANNLDFYDVTLQNTGTTSFMFSTKGTFDSVKAFNTNYGCALSGASSVINNLYARNIFFVFWSIMPTGHHYMIDADLDWSKKKNWWNSGNWGVYRQYTLNLQTTPNAKITIMNHTDIVYQEYAYDNGTIREPILTMGHYMESTGNTLNSHNPYSIEIKKVGYHTYAQEFTLNEPIRWHILLLPDRVQVGSKIIRPARRS